MLYILFLILNHFVACSISQFNTHTYYTSYFKSKFSNIYEESSISNSKRQINLLQNQYSYLKSLTVSTSKVFISAKTVSRSISYTLSNSITYSFLNEGEYAVSETKSYFTVYYYFDSPTITISLISTRISCVLLIEGKKFSDEQLIGIVCGSVSAFILLISIVILYFKRNKERNFFIDEYDIINPLDNENEGNTEKVVSEENVNITEIDSQEVDSWL